MGVILGSITTVDIEGTDGFQNISWQVQVNSNRLWQLGNWSAYKTQVTKILTVNVTTYAGVLGSVNLIPNTSCDDSTATKDVVISASACGVGGTSVNFNEVGMYITSYSYSKGDPQAFGTETWAFQKWVDSGVVGIDYINTSAPTFVLQGTAEGSYSGDASNMGIVLAPNGQVTGSQGSVSAGIPGLGNADTTTYGIVTSIGGGGLEEAGKIGQSSASIPHQPLYLG